MVADEYGAVACLMITGDHFGGVYLSASADLGGVQMCFGFIHFDFSGKPF